jgi:predicted dehydrogenase/GNAT superfamily N-acetyltransferase
MSQISHTVQFVDEASTKLINFFERTFGEEPSRTKLKKAVFWMVLKPGSDEIIGASATIYQPLASQDQLEAYAWLMGVAKAYHRQGIGRLLLHAMCSDAQKRSCVQMRLKTFQRWDALQALIREEGWVRHQTTRGDRFDKVEEEWILPFLDQALRVILVGANPEGRGGEWAQAVNRSKFAKIVGVVDTNDNILHTWRDQNILAATKIKYLMESMDNQGLPRPEAAILCLPHSQYLQARESCFEYNLSMLHEKPLGTRLEEIIELKNKLEENPRTLVVGVQRRAHPTYIYLRNQIADKIEAGLRPETVYVQFSLGIPEPVPQTRDVADHSPQQWRTNKSIAMGGGLIDLGYHAIDLVHFILACPLDVISCNLWKGNCPAFSNEIENRASIVGRCGPTWVRIDIDRHGGKKAEYMDLHFEGQHFHATREEVHINDRKEYICKRSWEEAEEGVIARLAIEAKNPNPSPPEFWEHYAVMQVIESAYALVATSGFQKSESRENE